MDKRTLRLAGVVGFASPFFTFACILGAVASWREFDWVTNALSDLGVQGGITGPLFNVGLVGSGLLFSVFNVGLYSLVGKRLMGKAGTAAFLWVCFSLVAIGIFNEKFVPLHFLVSVSFFVSLPIALLILAVSFWLWGKKALGAFTLAVGLAAPAPWVLQFAVSYVQNVAIPEFISGLLGAVWVMVLSYVMLKESSRVSAAKSL